MNDEVKRITDGLQKAIQAEHEGRHFYLMAAHNTEDARGQEIFQTLAEEELNHFHYLQKQYKSIMKTGKVDASATLGAKKNWPAAIQSSRTQSRTVSVRPITK
ncbi:MAG: ferritin family protein [Candidatus Latescibacterota bacterium]